MKSKLFMILLLVGGLSVLASVANAETIAEFEDAGTPGVDTCPGTAGDGWRSAWGVDATGTSSATAVLETSDPLFANSGNCVSFEQADDSTDGCSASLNRRYYLTDLNDDYYISFSIRFDDLSMWTVMDETLQKTTSDYFYICGTTDDNYNHDGSETSWAFRAQGMKADGSFANALHFRFMSSTVDDEWTDFPVQEGNTYDISILVHEADHTYEATVSEVGTANSYTTSVPHGMESAVTSSYLSFVAEMRSQGGNTFGYSVDNVRIANTPPTDVPEPSTMILLLGTLIGFLAWRKKK